MRWSHGWMRRARIALVVVYGIVLPLLLISATSAHKHFVGQTWAHSVDTSGNRDRMRVWNDNANGSEVGYAIAAWDSIGTVNVRQIGNNNKKDRDVKTARYGEADLGNLSHDCYQVTWLGLYNFKGRNPPDAIFINYCMAFWDGGTWPGSQLYKGPTSQNRRVRSYVHEMGHALGLDHNGLAQCQSVVADIPSDAATSCYGVQSHDISDMQTYWP